MMYSGHTATSLYRYCAAQRGVLNQFPEADVFRCTLYSSYHEELILIDIIVHLFDLSSHLHLIHEI